MLLYSIALARTIDSELHDYVALRWQNSAGERFDNSPSSTLCLGYPHAPPHC